jgi:hypothetical protein
VQSGDTTVSSFEKHFPVDFEKIVFDRQIAAPAANGMIVYTSFCKKATIDYVAVDANTPLFKVHFKQADPFAETIDTAYEIVAAGAQV